MVLVGAALLFASLLAACGAAFPLPEPSSTTTARHSSRQPAPLTLPPPARRPGSPELLPASLLLSWTAARPPADARGLFDEEVYAITGERLDLNRFSGRFALVVNIHPTDPHWGTQLEWMARESASSSHLGGCRLCCREAVDPL
jgi:hypothetical protein